ncbi:hypothetical protein ACOYW6_00910 [Parablastomonas sp. CN1-191]|uniref:hypothetical protein n=1 Tax=Parablastomonas sp. CN1-191 TaxID=3400908 RepID=UPI003BF87E4C
MKTIALAAALIAPTVAAAQDAPRADGGPAAGAEIYVSRDGDDTSMVKLLGRALVDYHGRDDYKGIAAEQVWITPMGGARVTQQRLYADLAGPLGNGWHYRARVGTNFKTVLGSAEVRTDDYRTSLFVERDIVETPQGLQRGLMYTFAGVSQDVTFGPRDVLSLTGGVQEFSPGDNVRLHARATYTHVLAEQAGLSFQLRGRYYHSTHPGEFDYYSPRNYAEVLPVLRMRRFLKDGSMVLGALGYGAQRDDFSGWKPSRYANLRYESPRNARGWDAFADVTYTNNSSVSGISYYYVLGRAGFTHRF